jgi:uncharacterized coiled-coil protein SlyX
VSDEQAMARLTEVEIKITHQERLVEELNQVVIEQRAEIDEMRKRLARFEKILSNLNEEAVNEPPPHY